MATLWTEPNPRTALEAAGASARTQTHQLVSAELPLVTGLTVEAGNRLGHGFEVLDFRHIPGTQHDGMHLERVRAALNEILADAPWSTFGADRDGRATITCNTDLDDRDRRILWEIIQTWRADRARVPGPREGDLVRVPNEQLAAGHAVRRIARAWEACGDPAGGGFQLTMEPVVPSQFHLCGRGLSHSGDLESPIRTPLVATGETRPARAWMWHHGVARGGNGVDVWVMVPVWSLDAAS